MRPQRVTFTSDGLDLVGDLYLPQDTRDRAPAVVLTGPYTAVKEQVTGNYAKRLADAGFVSLAFDHRNFGESTGTPRQHEDAAGKLADLRDAVSYLRTLPQVDPERIGVCGVCLGGAYALRFAAFDPRVKALALIAAAYNDPARMRQRLGDEGYRGQLAYLADVAQRQYETGEVSYVPAVRADEGPAGMPGPEPFEYYGTDRAASPHWANQITQLSWRELLTLDAGFAAALISPTPVLIVHGRTDGYLPPQDAQWAYEQAGEPKDILWLDTTNHIDLYDNERFVAPAAERAADWFAEHLRRASTVSA